MWQLRRGLLAGVAVYAGAAGPTPALSLDFTALTPAAMATAGVTFSRASLAGQYDSTGKWTFAPNNFEIQSGDWTSLNGGSNANTTVTGNAATDPVGGNAATRLQMNAGSSTYYYKRVSTIVPTDAVIASMYLRAVSGTVTVKLRCTGDAGGAAVVSANLTTSWQRFSIPVTPTLGGGNYIEYGVDTRNAVTGDDELAKDVYIWGGQLEKVTYETTARAYNPTTGSVYYGPRFDYNPATLAAKGLLIEGAATNLARQNIALNVAPWTSIGAKASISANVTTSPDGTSNADKLVEDNTASTDHGWVQNIATSATTQYTISVYAKPAGRNNFLFYLGGGAVGGGDAGYYFDVSAGTVGPKNGPGTPIAASIQSVGNGWYRCIQTFTTGGGASIDCALYPADSSPSNVYSGDGVSGVYLWGLQLEVGDCATSLIFTTSASVTRAAEDGNCFLTPAVGFVSNDFSLVIVGQTASIAYGKQICGTPAPNGRVIYFDGSFVELGAVFGGDATTPNSPTVNTQYKIGGSWKVAGLSIVLNGGGVGTSATTGIAGKTTISIYGACVWHKTWALYFGALPDATLQSLTT